MATIGGTDLHVGDENIVCGAAFQLSTPSPVDWTYELMDGVLVAVQRGCKHIVVLLPRLELDSALTATGYQYAQRALDMLSIQADADLTIPGAFEDDIAWWRTDGKVTLRLSVIASNRLSASFSGTVLDKQGSIVLGPPPPPPPEWHPAFRYFRLSQTTEDLYEAYRNIFLAFEAVANTMYPQHEGEGEVKWFKRVTRLLDHQLDDCVAPGVTDVVKAFQDEQYQAIRCALFHAKQHRDPILPGEFTNRQQVALAYERLARLVIKLCQQHLHVRRHGGVITRAGFNLIMDGLSLQLILGVSPQSNITATLLDQLGDNSRLTNLVTRFVGSMDAGDFNFTFSGKTAVADLADPHVRSVISHGGELKPVLFSNGSIDDLFLEQVDLLEVSHIFAMSNRSYPRVRFSL